MTGHLQKLSVSQLETALAGCGRVRLKVPGRQITTFKLGGPMAAVIEPGSLSALLSAVKVLAEHEVQFKILGAGSNLLISDNGIAEPVITLGRAFSGWNSSFEPAGNGTDFYERLEKLFSGETGRADIARLEQNEPGQGISIIAGGGASLMSLSRLTATAGLAGLEFAAGIPASLGGAVFMNAGAHGGSIADVLSRAALVTAAGEIIVKTRRELSYTYRHSGIPAGSVVIAAELQLQAGPADEVQARRSACLDYRKRTQPLHLPSAGSVFRNPMVQAAGDLNPLLQDPAIVTPAAAQLLDQLGFRGRRIGGVQFSDLHANWLVNPGPDGRAADAAELMRQAQAEVFDRFGVKLQPEIIEWP